MVSHKLWPIFPLISHKRSIKKTNQFYIFVLFAVSKISNLLNISGFYMFLNEPVAARELYYQTELKCIGVRDGKGPLKIMM